MTKPVGRYKANAAHVQAARILKKEGWALTVGDKVGYVIPSSSRTKQVAPVALRILSMFGAKEEDLLTPKPAEKARTLVDFFGGD